jgi:Zinc carboxypeptidase
MHPSIRIILILIFSLIHSTFSSLAQSKYHTFDEMTKELTSLTSSSRNIASMTSLARTIEKRDIWAVTIGGPDADKHHAVLIVGGVEANRIIGSELVFQFLRSLIHGYGNVDSITALVNSTTFYIIPRVNPDATEAFFVIPQYERRFNARPVDDDHDGQIDEDGPDDTNGDGLITMMRILDNRGEWIPHPEDPRIMKKADQSKGEVGMYKVMIEGFDNDKDDQWNEDEKGGVEFNHNFPYNYQFFTPGAGPYQISEEEPRAVIEFCDSHPNIAVVMTFSSEDNLNNPWKKEPRQGTALTQQRSRRRMMMMEGEEDYSPRFITSVLDEDEQYFSYISEQFKGITNFKGAPSSTKGEGSFGEWAYYHFGRWSFIAVPWWIPEVEDKSTDTTKKKKFDMRKEKGLEDKSDECTEMIHALKWFDAQVRKDNFINWQTVKHRDFPNQKVEVGGFRPFVLKNPPAESIETIAQRYNTFITWLASKLPNIGIRNIKVEPIEGKIFRIKADIVNSGYFPTNSSMANRVRWSRNVKVTIGLSKNQKLTSGNPVNILRPISGNGGREEMTWLVIGNTGDTITITAESPTAGTATETVRLK